MELQAKELRIGNYILAKFGIEWSEDIISCGHYLDVINTRDKYLIKPIPITEDWLLKFGFVNVGDYFKKGILYVEQSEGMDFKTCTLVDSECELDIKYVHSLQNLYFALTNEELTIK